MGVDVSMENMIVYLHDMLDKRLAMARRQPQTLFVRVQMVNQLVVSALFYMLQVYPRDFDLLDKMDSQVRNFV